MSNLRIMVRTRLFSVLLFLGVVLSGVLLPGHTVSAADCGNVTDADGNVYNTIVIGTQCWMRQNMRVGRIISPFGSGSPMSNNGVIEKFCFDDVASNCTSNHPTYPDGGLYSWNEAMQYSMSEGAQGICPAGWHIPSDAEWSILGSYLSNNQVSALYNALKPGGTSGFEANFAGFLGPVYYQRGSHVFIISSTVVGNRFIAKAANTAQRQWVTNWFGYNSAGYAWSVRCVKPAPNPVNGVCAATHYACTAGTSVNNVSATSYTWNCNGIDGGTNASCSEAKPTGTVNVSSNIAASWTITGPVTIFGSGTTQTSPSQPVGAYTITWGAVAGYTKPVSSSQTLVNGGTINFNGIYTAAVPAVPASFTATPQACGTGQINTTWTAVAGATGYDTQIDGGAWINRGNVTAYNFTGLAAGSSHTINVRAWNGSGAGASRASTPSPVTAPVACAAACSAGTVKNWTVGGNSCTGTTPLTNDGLSGTVIDSTAPNTGSAAFLCTSGTWAVAENAGASCVVAAIAPTLTITAASNLIRYDSSTSVTVTTTSTNPLTCGIYGATIAPETNIMLGPLTTLTHTIPNTKNIKAKQQVLVECLDTVTGLTGTADTYIEVLPKIQEV